MSNAVYGPVGLLNATLGGTPGNALAETRTYDYRTFLSSLSVGSGGSVYSLGLTYTGNGDILNATDLNGNWSYTYDDFNRLAQATNATPNPQQIYQYVYDRFGNRWQQNYTQGQGQGFPVSLTMSGNNRISTPGYQYDAAGNLLMDNLNCYTYDAENRLSSVAPETFPGSDVCGATTNELSLRPGWAARGQDAEWVGGKSELLRCGGAHDRRD